MEDEKDSLLPTKDDYKIQNDEIVEIKRGIGPLAAASNLCLGVVGSGQLTLPYAMKGAGLAFGICLLILLGGFAIIVLEMLASIARSRPSTEGYGDILRLTIGPRWAKLANVTLGLLTWGGTISYLIVIKQEWVMLAEEFNLHLCDACLILINTLVIIYPLSLLRDFSSLQFSSFLGAFVALCVTFTVLFEAPWNENGGGFDFCNGNPDDDNLDDNTTNPDDDSVKFLPAGPFDFFTSMPLMAFALNSAWCYVAILAQTKTVKLNENSYNPGEKQYQFPSERNIQIPILGGHVIIMVNYLLLSTVGYLSYCDNTESNILQNLPNSPLVLTARCLLICQLSLGTPLTLNVTRSTLYLNLLEPKGWVPKWEGETKMKAMAVHVGITSFLLFSALALSLAVSSLEVVVSLTSSICASGIIFIFPSLSYRYYVQQSENLSYHTLRKNLPLGLVAFGGMMLVCGVTATIAGLIM